MAAFRDLHAFTVFEAACHPDLLLGGVYETLARAIHDDYVAHQRLEGHTPETNPSMAPWEDLPEHLKESNRDQAAHIGVKLAATGCGLSPSPTGTQSRSGSPRRRSRGWPAWSTIAGSGITWAEGGDTPPGHTTRIGGPIPT